MLVKPFVLDGHGGVDQSLGDLVPGCGLTVGGGIDLLQKLNISVIVHIMNIRGLLDVIVFIGPVLGFLQNVILKIFGQSAHENHTADQADQQHRGCRANGDLGGGEECRAKGINKLDRPVGIPLLANLFPAPVVLILICHR